MFGLFDLSVEGMWTNPMLDAWSGFSNFEIKVEVIIPEIIIPPQPTFIGGGIHSAFYSFKLAKQIEREDEEVLAVINQFLFLEAT